MTKKSKSQSKNKSVASKKSMPKSVEVSVESVAAMAAMLANYRSATSDLIDRRQELLAKVAGAIAAGLVTSPTPQIAKPEAMATVAIDIAEAILAKAGIPTIGAVAAPAPGASVHDDGLGAAS